jgi:hypothetical protein
VDLQRGGNGGSSCSDNTGYDLRSSGVDGASLLDTCFLGSCFVGDLPSIASHFKPLQTFYQIYSLDAVVTKALRFDNKRFKFPSPLACDARENLRPFAKIGESLLTESFLFNSF